ncbi:MAG: hypothetical protein M3R10_08405 [Verrucomicrobiota bacterium]|nr:hypothetical protein [Verrucomicrobiota bacterium]
MRARYCEPKIQSLTKTDGLTYRVKEILAGLGDGYSSNGASSNGSGVEAAVSAANRAGKAGDTPAPTTAVATDRAEAKVSPARDRAQDNTPTKPGTEAAQASAGLQDHSKHPPGERAEDAAIAVKGDQPNK